MASQSGSPDGGRHLRSFFIIALPRSLSTLIYDHCASALGLKSPGWTSAGEVLNGDRMVMFPARCNHEGLKYSPPEQTRQFARLSSFLDDVVIHHGHIYKDVVQPFVAADWLSRQNLPVLRIRRSIGEVVWAMLQKDWLYPGNAALHGESSVDRLIYGLIRAQRALDALPCQTVLFDDLIRSEQALESALQKLYPEVHLPAIRYIDERFQVRSQALVTQRTNKQWNAIQRRVAEIVASERGS